MKQGIALIFLTSVRDGIFMRNIEFRNPTNFIDIKNRAILEFQDEDQFIKVAEKHLLFKPVPPVSWQRVEGDTGLSDIAPYDSSKVWNPKLSIPDTLPEITIHSFGQYESDDVSYHLIAVEATHVEIGLRNVTTVLGGICATGDVLLEEPMHIRATILEGWEKHSFPYIV